jgi:DNA-binding transcriptional MocR family regulator
VKEESSIRGRTASQLAASLERAIRVGELRPGDRLPPIRELAAQVAASHVTVASAYRRLRERGLVVAAGRAGTRVAEQPPLPVRRAAPVPPGARDLADGNPDIRLLPPLPALEPEHVLYGAPAKDPGLVAILADTLRADGVPADHLAIVGGALDAIERLLGAYLRPGDAVAVEDPGFTRLLDLIPVLGLARVPVAVDDGGARPESLERALAHGVEAVVLTPRAQNPTGAAFDVKRAAELRRVIRRRPDVLVIEDDHAAGVAGAPFQSVAATAERWAVIRSFAIALGPDLRVAGVVGDETTIARVEGRQLVGAGWVSHLLQRLVARQLTSAKAKSAVARAERTYAARRATLLDALSARGIEGWGRSGLSVWIPVAEEAAIVQALAAAGYAVAAGERFRLRSGPAIRISIARLDEGEAGEAAAALASVLGPTASTYTA